MTQKDLLTGWTSIVTVSFGGFRRRGDGLGREALRRDSFALMSNALYSIH